MFNSEDHLSGKVGSHGSQQWQHLMTVDTAQAHSHGHRARKAASRTRPSQAPFQLGAASSSFKRRSQHQHHQHQHQHQQSSTKTLSGSRHSADPRSVSPIRYRPVRRGHGGNPGPRARPTPMVMAAEASRHQAKLEQPSSATVVKKHTMRSPPPPNIGREGAPHHRHAAQVPRGHSKSADRIAAQVLLRKQRLQRPSEPPVLYTQPHRINAAGGVTVLNPAAPAFRGSVHGGGPVSVAAASQGSGESKEGARHKPSGSGGAMASVLGDLDRFVARNYGVQARAEAAQSVEAHNPFPASMTPVTPTHLQPLTAPHPTPSAPIRPPHSSTDDLLSQSPSLEHARHHHLAASTQPVRRPAHTHAPGVHWQHTISSSDGEAAMDARRRRSSASSVASIVSKAQSRLSSRAGPSGSDAATFTVHNPPGFEGIQLSPGMPLPPTGIPPRFFIQDSSPIFSGLRGAGDATFENGVWSRQVFPSGTPSTRQEATYLNNVLNEMLALASAGDLTLDAAAPLTFPCPDQPDVSCAHDHADASFAIPGDLGVAGSPNDAHSFPGFQPEVLSELSVWSVVMQEAIRQVYAHCEERAIVLERARVRLFHILSAADEWIRQQQRARAQTEAAVAGSLAHVETCKRRIHSLAHGNHTQARQATLREAALAAEVIRLRRELETERLRKFADDGAGYTRTRSIRSEVRALTGAVLSSSTDFLDRRRNAALQARLLWRLAKDAVLEQVAARLKEKKHVAVVGLSTERKPRQRRRRSIVAPPVVPLLKRVDTEALFFGKGLPLEGALHKPSAAMLLQGRVLRHRGTQTNETGLGGV